MSERLRSEEKLEELRAIHSKDTARGYAMFKDCVLPGKFADVERQIEEFEVFDDDVWIITFPKSGTTWAEEMVWCISNNVDLETARKVKSSIRIPFLEMAGLVEADEQLTQSRPELFDSLNFAKNCARPRFIKTHLPWQLLPQQIRNRQRNPKIVYVFRNPKDVCVSYYHHCKLLQNFTGDFDLFWQLFITDKLNWCPYFANVLGYWQNRDNPNFLFLKYEEMKEDLTKVLKTAVNFLKANLSQAQIVSLRHHLSFDEMKRNKAVNKEDLIEICVENGLSSDPKGRFIRNGIIGSHKAEMSEEVIGVFDWWIEENLANTDLQL